MNGLKLIKNQSLAEDCQEKKAEVASAGYYLVK